MVSKDWQSTANICREIQHKSINQEWLLPESKLPSKDRLNVLNIPQECGLLTQEELLVTETSAVDLVKKMAAGEWTAEKVLIAFLKRATIGQQLLNFATEFMVEDAIAAARQLDAYFAKTGKIVGPLHGVPISVKEHVGFEGRICNTGYVAWITNIPTEDALLVRLLKQAGAVFHVRTNEPQSLMHLDTNNNITGKTLNPHNLLLTPGGSSGGEGASIAFKCAALGIGTDVGGSIRAPAAFNGVYGFRPTALRLPFAGVHVAGAGQESIRCVIGPLTNSLTDIDLFMQTVIDQEPWNEESNLVPLSWRTLEPARGFTLGILRDDGMVRPHPPILRALDVAGEKLAKAGIRVVEWEAVDHAHGWEILQPLYFPDGGACQRDILEESGEPVHALTKLALDYGRVLSVPENWEYNRRRDGYRDRYQKAMRERGVDFILCPAYLGVAPEQGTATYWMYTAIWNLLDQPGVVFPSGLKVDEELDKKDMSYRPRSEADKKEYERYSPEKFGGMPICYQLVGKHFKDEETLAAAKSIEAIMKA